MEKSVGSFYLIESTEMDNDLSAGQAHQVVVVLLVDAHLEAGRAAAELALVGHADDG